MNTLTNKRIKDLAAGNAFTCIQDDEGVELAKRLLAAEAQLAELRGQAPYKLPNRGTGTDPYSLGRNDVLDVIKRECGEVYARPVPPAASQPSYRDGIEKEFRYYIDDQIKFYSYSCDRNDAVGTADALTMSQHRLRFYQQAKALISASQPYTVPDERPADSSDGNDTEAWFDEGWNACRAAMLQSGGKS